MSDVHPQRSRSDELALIRTDLANERTLLAYLRTSLMVLGTGITLVKFFAESDQFRQTGWGLVVAGLLVGGLGVVRFLSMRQRLRD